MDTDKAVLGMEQKLRSTEKLLALFKTNPTSENEKDLRNALRELAILEWEAE